MACVIEFQISNKQVRISELYKFDQILKGETNDEEEETNEQEASLEETEETEEKRGEQ
jgi:ABC-type Zn2+ transport system substrate-binding protein/surface adhesin